RALAQVPDTQHPLDWQSLVDPPQHGAVLDAEALGPIRRVARLASERQHPAVPPVALLLLSSRPPTVAGFVAAVVIDPVDRMLRRRAQPHVRHERVERVPPAIADRDAPAPVVAVGWIARVAASIPHRNP